MASLILAGAVLFGSAPAHAAETKYSLANGCFALKSQSAGFVAKAPGGGYIANAAAIGEAEPFRMQATDLAKYLFYGKQPDFMVAGAAAAGSEDRTVESAKEPSGAAVWRVDDAAGGAFRIVSLGASKVLAAGSGGDLALVDPNGAGSNALFTFEQADGCATYPEIEVSATGTPGTGATPYGEVSGLLDAHMHLMAFEFLGGSVHCGRPWHPFGVTHAMVDCPDHGPGGVGAALESVISYGTPVHPHDTVGWPTFKDWPHHKSLTHDQTYYKWLERSWMGGLRVFVNLLVDNSALCDLYPLKRNPCDEMNTARLELKRTREIQDYIDAQNGGPGKGWFRIVTDPFEARRVINEGKLAVVIGMETSELFGCGLNGDKPECDRAQIDRQLDEFYDLGVRSLEIVNKFDNALSGVAGDAGATGVVTNSGNHWETGRFWQLETCTGEGYDKPQATAVNQDNLVGGVLQMFLPPGAAPVYPQPPHCNKLGLSALGEYLVERMIDKGMLLDPDHMSALGRDQALAIAATHDYSGVLSSHSWSSEDAYPKIYRAGGVITPYAGSSTDFVKAWESLKGQADPRFYYGFGYGADMNGFGAQGAPRLGAKNPVKYPFKSFDGKVTLDKQTSGKRVFDINVDGVAHYGLYPDWIEDLRMIAGDQIVKEMARGPEAYLQTWERANGVPAEACRSARGRLSRKGFFKVFLGDTPNQLLKRAGQPADRAGRDWRWCVQGTRNRKAHLSAAFTTGGKVALVASNALGHRALRVGRGGRASRLRGTRSFGKGLRVRRAGRGTSYVFGVRRGRVTFVAVASRSALRSRARLRSYLKLAGLR